MEFSSFRSIGRTATHGIIFGLSAAFTIALVSLVYAATTYYTDLPTVSSGSGLTATSWNNLIDHANKAVKQDTEVLTVTGGKIGVGTTIPANILSVNGNMDASRFGINAAGTAPSNGMFAPIGNTIGFSVGGTEQVRITPSGNVGIGTLSPGQKLSVVGTVESTSGGFKFPDGTIQTSAAGSGWKTFGGMYSYYVGGRGGACGAGSNHQFSNIANPVTWGLSCPAGFNDTIIISMNYCEANVGSVGYDTHMCWK